MPCDSSLKAKLVAPSQELEAEIGSEENVPKSYRTKAPQVLGLILLVFTALVWMSPGRTLQGGSSTWKAGAQVEEVVQLSQQSRQITCEGATGGTCFIAGCIAERGNTSCAVTMGIGRFGWHSCTCQWPTPCAHADGHCYPHLETGWRSSLRHDSDWMVAFAVAPVMRSGATKILSELLALDHIISVPGTHVSIDFQKMKTWSDVRDASRFKYAWQAVFVSAAKAVGLHAMQPCMFAVPYIAFSDSMGWVQYICATVVIMNEALYLVILVWAIFSNPKFLLYAPLNDTLDPLQMDFDGIGAAWYFISPSLFIYRHAGGAFNTEKWLLMALFSLFASGCAWIAMTIGLLGYGVMFPSLLIGYLLAALELPCFAYGFFLEWVEI